jgi:ankyrin repeat protein
MVPLLRAHGADGSAQSDIGYTALIWTASCGPAEVVSTLVFHGADVNTKDQGGEIAVSP